MIKNIIFDFGDVFINLDKTATPRALNQLGLQELTPELDSLFKEYEMGLFSSDYFVERTSSFFPNVSTATLLNAWNAILLDFPMHRLEFLEALAKENKYRLFLLSNTNELHIEYVKETTGKEFFTRFKNCFEVFYLSYEMKKRKPNPDIYKQVLEENRLNPRATLFIDDTKENTDTAAQLGIQTWHLQVGQEEVTELKTKL